MKYEVTMVHEIMNIEATDFNIIGNMVVFYNENGKSIYAFSNVINVKKVKEGEKND